MLFNLTMFPVGSGDRLSKPVADVVAEIERAGLKYTANGAATLIEGNWTEVMPVIQRAFTKLRAYNDRVYMVLTADDHAGVADRIHEAVEDLDRELGHAVSR